MESKFWTVTVTFKRYNSDGRLVDSERAGEVWAKTAEQARLMYEPLFYSEEPDAELDSEKFSVKPGRMTA